MEVKEMQEAKTLENLTEAVTYYRDLVDEIDRLQLSKEIAKKVILGKFQETGMRWYDTPSGLRARVDTRMGRETIGVKEARAMLPEDVFNKLLRVGDTIVVLSVRQVKVEEVNDG